MATKPPMALGLFWMPDSYKLPFGDPLRRHLRDRLADWCGEPVCDYPFFDLIGPSGPGGVLDEVKRALAVTDRLMFDLTGLDPARVRQDWDSPYSWAYTCKELRTVLSNPEWLAKTTFYLNGAVVDHDTVRETYDPHAHARKVTRAARRALRNVARAALAAMAVAT